MPELPDLETYLAALEARTLETRLGEIRLTSPFLLRSVSPPLKAARGRRVVGLRRLGKRLVFDLEERLFLVLHLMVAGRLRWKPLGAMPPKKSGLAAFDFEQGTLILTEAGSKKRASLHLVEGLEALALQALRQSLYRRERAFVPGDPDNAPRVDGATESGGRQRLSRKGHGLST